MLSHGQGKAGEVCLVRMKSIHQIPGNRLPGCRGWQGVACMESMDWGISTKSHCLGSNPSPTTYWLTLTS